MANPGLLVYFERAQNELIRPVSNGEYFPFSDNLILRERGWEFGETVPALLAFSPSTIDYLAIAKRGKYSATAKFRVDFWGMFKLDSLATKAVEAKLGSEINQYFVSASRPAKSPISGEIWLKLVQVVKQLLPRLSDDIDRIISLSRYTNYHLTGPIADVFLQEREALGIALDIFSTKAELRQQVLKSWAPQESSVSDVNEKDSTARLKDNDGLHSFVGGIPDRFRRQEESAISHDLFNWKGMTPTHVSGTTHFERGDRQLDVIYANRNSLERTLGVDLIYCNERYALFVLVQYKLMKREHNQWVYRPDSQMMDELERMDTFHKRFDEKLPITDHAEFRLNHDGFFFKLVPNEGLRPASGELIQGMYFLREYMRFLTGEGGAKGMKGGRIITAHHAPRYLSNSEFAAGVNGGWIGTRGNQSKIIREILKQYYETGNALMFARESSMDKNRTHDHSLFEEE